MIDPQDVATYLGVVLDDRVQICAEAASVWVQKRRSLTPPPELWADPDVYLGATMYAGLLYTQRAQPQGMPGFDELGSYSEDVGMAMVQIYRLCGADPVIA